MIIRNPIYKNCSTYCAGSGTKTRTKRHVFVSQWWWFTWADQTQTSDHVPAAAAAAAQQHQVWRPALLSSELKSPSFLLHRESGQEVRTSDVLYLHEMLVSCYWPAKVPPAASVRVLTTESLWWPAVQQCGVQCAVQTAASPPPRHHQDSVSRETGDVRTPRTSELQHSAVTKTHNISGLIFTATEYGVPDLDNIQTCWARLGQRSQLSSPSPDLKMRKD